MGYKLSMDGATTVELGRLVRLVENGLNGHHLRAQMVSEDPSAPSSAPPCPASAPDCNDGTKGGHDLVLEPASIPGGHDEGTKGGHDLILIVVVAVIAASVGYVAGKRNKGTKGGHD
jgi:hypothetical protein